MLFLGLVGALAGLLTYRLLNAVREPEVVVRVGQPAPTAAESALARAADKKAESGIEDRHRRAIRDFFRDAGGRITDLRVLRSAMYLSDEVDQALRRHDQELGVGWRQYNRFYAEGIEDVFTNVPSGRSQLVLAAPSSTGSELKEDEPGVRSVQYRASRDALLQQVARVVESVERQQLARLGATSESVPDASVPAATDSPVTGGADRPTADPFARYAPSRVIRPRELPYEPRVSRHLRASVFQPYVPANELDAQGQAESVRRRLLRYRGDGTRPDAKVDTL